MDDLTSTITQILGDPQKMEQLRNVARQLGINPDMPGGAGAAVDPAAVAQAVSAAQGLASGVGANNHSASPSEQTQNNPSSSGQTQAAGGNAGGMFNSQALASITEIMQTFNASDKNIDLLKSLKPHFSGARAGKIDDAVRIMQVMRTWPKVRDSGLLGNLGALLGGGGKR